MFSLIITIISIALVAALALATLYFGGSAFNKGSADAEASKILLQGQQILGAAELYKAEKGAWPVNLDALVAQGYLKSIPVSGVSAVSESFAEGQAWKTVSDNKPVYVKETVTPSICQGVNKKAYGIEGVLKQMRLLLVAQCYGDDNLKLQTVFAKSTDELALAVAAPNAGILLGTPVAGGVPTDLTGDAWQIAPGAVVSGSPVTTGGGVTVEALNWTFPGQVLNTSGTKQFAVTNGSTSEVSLTVGLLSANPSLKTTHNCATLPAGQSCQITVTFSPLSAGAITDTLVVNGAGPEKTGSLQGEGIASASPLSFIVNPNYLAFGGVPERTSSVQTFTLYNTSDVPLTLASATSRENQMTGPAFTSTHNCYGVVPSGNCTVTATFTPPVTGYFASYLDLRVIGKEYDNERVEVYGSGDYNPPPAGAGKLEYSYNGTVIEGYADDAAGLYTIHEFEFGAVGWDSLGPVQATYDLASVQVTLKNVGLETLTQIIPFSDTNDYFSHQRITGTTCGTVLPAGDACTVTFTLFKVHGADNGDGSYSGSVSVYGYYSTPGGDEVTAELYVKHQVAPAFFITARNVEPNTGDGRPFHKYLDGFTMVPGRGILAYFWMTNNTSSPRAFTVSGTSKAIPSSLDPACGNGVIPANFVCPYVVAYTPGLEDVTGPLGVGGFSTMADAVTVTTGGRSLLLGILGSVSALNHNAGALPSIIDFGQLQYGFPEQRGLSIENVSDVTLTNVGGYFVAGGTGEWGAEAFSASAPGCTSVAPGERCTIVGVLDPYADGYYTANFIVTYTGSVLAKPAMTILFDGYSRFGPNLADYEYSTTQQEFIGPKYVNASSVSTVNAHSSYDASCPMSMGFQAANNCQTAVMTRQFRAAGYTTGICQLAPVFNEPGYSISFYTRCWEY